MNRPNSNILHNSLDFHAICIYLESLCIIFLIRPFHTNIARAILKEPKIYFYDRGFVKGGEGISLLNICAVCLLKHVQYFQDTTVTNISLCYRRTWWIHINPHRRGRIRKSIYI